MDKEIQKKPTSKKNSNPTSQVSVEVKLHYGLHRIKSADLHLNLHDIELDNCTLEELQSRFLELFKAHLEYLVSKEKKAVAYEILPNEQKHIEKLIQSFSLITPKHLNCYANTDAFSLHIPLDIQGLKSILQQKIKLYEAENNALNDAGFTVHKKKSANISFIFQIEPPKKDLGKAYEEFNALTEARKKKLPKKTEKIVSDDGIHLIDENSDGNDEDPVREIDRGRRCAIL